MRAAKVTVLVLAGALLIMGGEAWAAPMGTAFTYQGSLEDGGGPVTDTCDFEFELYTADPGGIKINGTLNKVVAVNAGVFTVVLDFGDGAFKGDGARFLDIKVCCPSGGCALEPLTPRKELTPAPHALALPGFYTRETPDGFGGVKNVNVIGGMLSDVGVDVEGATISGGGGTDDCNFFSDVNRVTDAFGTIGGGNSNTAGNSAGTVCDAPYATVGGGQDNTAREDYATVSGGQANTASARASVGGGSMNQALGSHTTISGGEGNATGVFSHATVGGGINNLADGVVSTVAGGIDNRAAGESSFVGGGQLNEATGSFSTVCGGFQNRAADRATVGGGDLNEAMDPCSVVAGGCGNRTDADYSTVGGGRSNNTLGNYATIPGGFDNLAVGDYSFAAGRRATVAAGHDGTFVWGDSTDADFVSTGTNQFLIRAGGGVGIGTGSPSAALDVVGTTELNGDLTVDSSTLFVDATLNRIGLGTTSPSYKLEIEGGANPLRVTGGGSSFPKLEFNVKTGGYGVLRIYDNNTNEDFRFDTNGNSWLRGGNVGIGTATPNVKLDVIGSIEYTGTIMDVSDERLKENIAPVTGALARIRKLRGVYFNMKDTPDQREVGLLAQNVREVLPEAVSVVEPETGHLGVSYPSLIALLVEAIKEMQDEKDARIVELSRRLSKLEAAKRTPSSMAMAGILCLGLGAASFGGRALRRRSLKEGAR